MAIPSIGCSWNVFRCSDAASCGTPVWMGKGLTCICFKGKASCSRVCINLIPIQEERLRRLRHQTKVYFDASRPEHHEALRALWSATYPGKQLQSLVSDQWKNMGWQGKDPSTDFSFGICTVLYAGVAVLGYTMFGEWRQSQFTLNMPQDLVSFL